jgi:thymidylate synthase (FAD)
MEPIMQVDVLDKGYIKLLESFGDELTIVNAARASFGVSKSALDDGDIRLLKYLWNNSHMSPLRHCLFRFEIKAPEFVLRQLFRHHVGIETTSTYATQMHGWSERSGRYKVIDEYHYPEEWRKQSSTAKQGSDGPLDSQNQKVANDIYTETMNQIELAYTKLIEMGVAKEQARIILPLSQYNTFIWTCSLQALLYFISLRNETHAQQEIQEYAKVFDTIVKEKFPHLYEIMYSNA